MEARIMATCKDCVNYSGCTSEWHKLSKIEHICHHFKTNADFVEVIRCKDCAYCELQYPAKAIGEEPIEGYFCWLNQKYLSPTDFCSHGVRKDSVEE